MSKYSIEESTITGMADKIRMLRGTVEIIRPENMASEIQAEADSGKMAIETCTVTVNGCNFEMSRQTIYYVNPLLGDKINVVECTSGLEVTFQVMKNSILFSRYIYTCAVDSYDNSAATLLYDHCDVGSVFLINDDVTLVISAD